MKKTIAISAFIAAGLVGSWYVSHTKKGAAENQEKAESVQAKESQNSDGEASKSEAKEIIYNVDFFEVESKTLRTYVASSSTLKADRQVDIFSKTSGQIDKILVEEGQKVNQGDVLLVLDGEEQELELQQMTVNLNKAKAEFERIEKSYKNQLIAAEQYEAKKFELERSTAEHEKAAHRVTLAKVKAPFSGTIVKRAIEVGQTIQPSEVLFTLAALNPLEAEVYFTESQVKGLRVNQTTRFAKNDAWEEAFPGYVKQISPVVDKETGTVKVTMAIPDAPEGIRPGTYVQLRVVTSTAEQPAVVPKRSLTFDSRQQAFAFIAKPHAEKADVFTVDKVGVEIGIEEGEWVSITKGLNRGEKVVLTGKESLKTGSLVRDSNQSAKQEIAQL